MRDVKNGWFLVGAGGLDVGVVVVAAAVGAPHEYIGFGMRSCTKTCALTFYGLVSAFCEVRTQRNSVVHSILDSAAMGHLTTLKMLIEPLCQTWFF